MRLLGIMATVWLAIVLSDKLLAQNKSVHEKSGIVMKDSSTTEAIDFAKLVRCLRNSNAKPRIVGGSEVRFDANYNFSEQRKVFKAIKTLQIYAEEAWPELIANLENDEYSYTLGFGESSKNYSVGQVCEQVVRNTLASAYLGVEQLLKGTAVPVGMLANPRLSDQKQLHAWLVKHRNESLVELQLMTLQDLSARVGEFGVTEEKKSAILDVIVDRKDFISRKNVPELANKFIPNRETWWYLTKDDVDK